MTEPDLHPYKDIGDRLRLMMAAHHIRSVNVEERLGISSGRWANYVVGKHRIPDDLVRQLRVYGISADWLLYGDERNITLEFANAIARHSKARHQPMSNGHIANFKRINPKTLPNVLRRLKALRIAIKGDGPGAQAAFAKDSGIQAPNWNTYERQRYGLRIGIDAAMKLVEKWDVTLDYIYFGKRHGVEQPLWEALQAAEKYVIEQEEQEDREEEAKRASPIAPHGQPRA